MEARVPGTSRIFVDVGLGVKVECTLTEAIEKITLRKAIAESQLSAILTEIGYLRASIEFMEQGIKVLSDTATTYKDEPSD